MKSEFPQKRYEEWKQWQFTSVVRPVDALSSACCTKFSDSESSALVASSSKSIAGFLIIALAMAIRCFWPPDNNAPRSPICKNGP